MDYILLAALVIVALSFGWSAGYKRGKKDGAREIFKALGVPEGARIESVSFTKEKRT